MSRELEILKEAVRILEKKEGNKLKLSSCEPEDIIQGNETDGKYIVLEQLSDEETLVISKEFMLESIRFDEDSPNYESSYLKKEIEKKCLPIFERDFGTENLVEHEVDLTSVDAQNEFGKCKCKIRPRTFDEARKYNNLLANENLSNLEWTCNSWSTESRGYKYSVAVVAPRGGIGGINCCCNCGVRPVCILKSNIFVSKGE